MAGIADPVIDARSRKSWRSRPGFFELTAACRAFSTGCSARTLLGAALVPWQSSPGLWDVFDHPRLLPRYPIENYVTNVGERILWWYDGNKAAKLEQAK